MLQERMVKSPVDRKVRTLVRVVAPLGFLACACGVSGPGTEVPPPGQAGANYFTETPAQPSYSPPESFAPTTSSPPTSEAAPSPVSQGSCTPDMLTVAAGQSEAGMGHVGVVITFTNKSAESCSLEGYPSVYGYDASGKLVMQAEPSIRGYLGGESADTPTNVSLPPGQVASVLIEGVDNSDNPDVSCPDPTTLLVSPNGTQPYTSIGGAMPGNCGKVYEHSYVAGDSGSD